MNAAMKNAPRGPVAQPVAAAPVPRYVSGFGNEGFTLGRNLRATYDENTPPFSWQLVNRAWGKMPAGYHLGRDLAEGMTADECLALQAEKLEAFADRLRELFARHAEDTAELTRFRQQLDAEIDRADMIAARRASRENKT